MNYFNYAIKCVIRNIIYKLMKPRNLIIIVVSLIIIFLLSQYTTVFGWEGDNEYTDKNNTIAMNYESIVNDFINRLNNLSHNNVNYNNLISMLNNGEMAFYLYYGDSNGSSMTGSNYFVTSNLNIIFYSKSTPNPSISTLERYNGMTTNMYNLSSSIQDYFYFINGILYTSSKPSSVVIPGVLISYVSPSWVSYYNNSSQEQTNEIVGAINSQTEAIQDQTESITSTDFDDTEVSIDTSSADIDNSTQQGLFTTVFNNFNSAISSDSVEYLEIPLVNNKGLRIPSNIVSSHLGSLTALINAFWYYLFGLYAFKFVNNLIIKIKDGSILDGYNSNEVITSDMM